MVFSNLIFLYAFLPLNLLFYILARGIRMKNAVMLVFSLVFYACGEPKYVLLLIGMALADWLLALAVEKAGSTLWRRTALIGACAVSLGLLGVFKYGTFVLGNLNALTGFPSVIPEIALPIGISFYTFQLLSYVVDVYRGEVPAQRDFSKLLLYTSLFHQCIAGPIVRYRDVSEEILYRKVSITEISRGIGRFTTGLGKKALLANTCGALADTLLLADTAASDASLLAENTAALAARPALGLWLGVLCFMLQIYLDFSAYSDMAIGMGLMIGFHYKENFDYPYASRSVSEFWRRWHISLGSFFRDYVYIPLGGNRKGMGRTLFNLLAVWFLTGLWHGASWNFVLWGLYFFVFIAAEKLFLRRVLEKLPAFFSHVYLLIVVFFGWILFRFRQLSLAGTVLAGLFGLNGNAFTNYETNALLFSHIFFLIVALIAVTPVVKYAGSFLEDASKNRPVIGRINAVVRVAAPPLLMLLSTMALVGNSYNPFLYFQF